MTRVIGQRAVVVGAGIAGLAAARALSDSFEEVVVFEGDRLTQESTARIGVPQGKHPHGLLVGGQRALTELFPRFEEQLLRAGAEAVDSAAFRVEIAGYDPMPQRDLGVTVYSASRPLIELTVRGELEKIPNIILHDRRRVEAVTAESDGSAVTGVRCATQAGGAAVRADLVVDASGRGAPTKRLLDAIGYPRPEASTIGINIDYSTAIYSVPDDAPADWRVVVTAAKAPAERRGGVILPIEGHRWIVGMSARHSQAPPPSCDEEFHTFARSLRTQTIYEAFKNAERLSPIAQHRFTGSVRVHWERLARLPRGLLPLGDAACRFNPIFGQGMSVAAQEAVLLRQLLDTVAGEPEPMSRLQSSYFDKLPGILDAPWSVAVADMIYPETTGKRPEAFERSMKFAAALQALAVRDPEIQRLTTEVQHLLKPPSVYRDPALQERVKAVMAEMTG